MPAYPECPVNIPGAGTRRNDAKQKRRDAFEVDNPDPFPPHPNNCDTGPQVSFSKSLKRAGATISDRGEVDTSAHARLLAALASGKFPDFEALATGTPPALGTPGGLKITNPIAGLTFDLEAPDTHALPVPVAPPFTSAETAAEMAELYWMALLRDQYIATLRSNSLYQTAINDLKTNYTFFKNFNGTNVPIGDDQLFRAAIPGKPGAFKGVHDGPFVSQFLLRGTAENNPAGNPVVTPQQGTVAVGSLRLSQRQRTVRLFSDFMTDLNEWRRVQEGVNRSNKDKLDLVTKRFIRCIRDIANYVHFDKIYQEYFVAACILLAEVPRTGMLKAKAKGTSDETFTGQFVPDLLDMTSEVLNPGNPYRGSAAQNGFATFGATHILTGLAEVATRAHRAVFFQKWQVHRRIRPEEFGGRVHFDARVVAGGHAKIYGVNDELLNSRTSPGVLWRINEHNKASFGDDTYLLPMAFPEGCPTHPAYPAAHATLAGASVTMLKAFFNEDFPITRDPARPDLELPPIFVSDINGLSLIEDSTSPAGLVLTVGGELNKLASNIAFGRGMAGVHWRSDNLQGLLLGEEIAIGLLKEQALGFREKASGFYEFTKFDGTKIRI